jgi:hypothetical protein
LDHGSGPRSSLPSGDIHRAFFAGVRTFERGANGSLKVT